MSKITPDLVAARLDAIAAHAALAGEQEALAALRFARAVVLRDEARPSLAQLDDLNRALTAANQDARRAEKENDELKKENARLRDECDRAAPCAACAEIHDPAHSCPAVFRRYAEEIDAVLREYFPDVDPNGKQLALMHQKFTALKALQASLQELVERRKAAGGGEGSDGRYARAEAALSLGAPPSSGPSGPDIKRLVERFLVWPLPSTVRADLCATMPNEPHRTGTNLLSADEARQMFEHVLAAAPPPPPSREGEGADAFVMWRESDRVWWKANRRGYTNDLLKAGVYDAAEAAKIESIRGEEKRIPLGRALDEFLDGADRRVVAAMVERFGATLHITERQLRERAEAERDEAVASKMRQVEIHRANTKEWQRALSAAESALAEAKARIDTLERSLAAANRAYDTAQERCERWARTFLQINFCRSPGPQGPCSLASPCSDCQDRLADLFGEADAVVPVKDPRLCRAGGAEANLVRVAALVRRVDQLERALRAVDEAISNDPRATSGYGPGSPDIPALGIIRGALQAPAAEPLIEALRAVLEPRGLHVVARPPRTARPQVLAAVDAPPAPAPGGYFGFTQEEQEQIREHLVSPRIVSIPRPISGEAHEAYEGMAAEAALRAYHESHKPGCTRRPGVWDPTCDGCTAAVERERALVKGGGA